MTLKKMTKLNFILERVMRRKNDLQLYKTYSKKPRILKVAELIKRTLAEILISQNFTLENGKNFIVFIKNVELSKDAKIATVFLKSFSNNHIDEESIIDAIEKSVLKIKKDFSRKIQLRYTPKLRFRIDFKKEEKLTDELND
tara:strand:+ start:25 stop:450 length:426 start_codon:yes stop_codon:yes gene_type:complete